MKLIASYFINFFFHLVNIKQFVPFKKYVFYSEVNCIIFVQKVKMNESMIIPKLSSLTGFMFKLFVICESLYSSWKP